MNTRYSKGEFLLTPNKSNLRGLEPAVQVLFMWLSDHSDDNDQSFPSRQTLAAECGISVKTLDRSMRKLIELGLVQKQARFNGNEQTTNLYRCVIVAPPSVKLSRGSVNLTPGRDKNDIQNSTHLTQPIEHIEIDKSISIGAGAKRQKKELEIPEFFKSLETTKSSDYPELQPALDGFIGMRKAMRKPLTSPALSLIVDELRSFHPGDAQSQRKCLDNATAGGWLKPIKLKDQPKASVTPEQILYPDRFVLPSKYAAALAGKMGVR